MPNFGGGELKDSCASVQGLSAAPSAAVVSLNASSASPLCLSNSLWSAGGMPGMPNFGGGAGGMPNFGAGGMPGGMNFEDLGDEGEGAGEWTAAWLQLFAGLGLLKGCWWCLCLREASH